MIFTTDNFTKVEIISSFFRIILEILLRVRMLNYKVYNRSFISDMILKNN